MLVEETGDDLLFLHRVSEGGSHPRREALLRCWVNLPPRAWDMETELDRLEPDDRSLLVQLGYWN